MSPDHLTKRVAVLKGYLGIENKRDDVVALEDEALRLGEQLPRQGHEESLDHRRRPACLFET